MKSILVCCFLIGLSTIGHAQIISPAKWSYAAKKTNKTEAVVFFKATIDAGWHIYSLNQPEGGPQKTSIVIIASDDYSLVGKVSEPKPNSKFDSNYGMNLLTFDKSVVFKQILKLKNSTAKVKGEITFMVCNDQRCLPPETIEFNVPIK